MSGAGPCAAVIPCLNEAASVGALTRSVQRFVQAIIVVDDGSTDTTSRAARDAGAVVLRHPAPRGKGAALITGWRHAASLGFDWAISLDGDGQHDPEDVPRLLRHADLTGARLVVGDRMSDPRGMPWLRWATNRWMSRSISRLAGRPLPDTQNGFRLMHLPSWQTLELEADHFEIESEVLVKFVRAGFRTEFVPVRVIYGAERSKIHPWRDTVRWWRWRRRLRACAV